MRDIKDIVIIILLVLTFSLFYFIMLGSFCHCGRVKCPNHCEEPLRSYLT